MLKWLPTCRSSRFERNSSGSSASSCSSISLESFRDGSVMEQNNDKGCDNGLSLFDRRLSIFPSSLEHNAACIFRSIESSSLSEPIELSSWLDISASTDVYFPRRPALDAFTNVRGYSESLILTRSANQKGIDLQQYTLLFLVFFFLFFPSSFPSFFYLLIRFKFIRVDLPLKGQIERVAFTEFARWRSIVPLVELFPIFSPANDGTVLVGSVVESVWWELIATFSSAT